MADDSTPSSHIAQLLDDDDANKKRQYSFYIRDKLYQKFMHVCKKRNLSGSKVISALMKDFIDKYGK